MATELPLIIPIFLPHLGCRERCLFCNQKAASSEMPSPSSVRGRIETSLGRIHPEMYERKRQVAFYGGSFSAMAEEEQIRYLGEVRPFLSSGRIDSIRISTRPDALDEKALGLLRGYGVKTVEIGAQSMIDPVLLLSRRGHKAEDTVSAALRLRRWEFEVGIHLMLGLPGDTIDRFLETVDRVISLKPDFLRIHPALVLRGSPLELLWQAGEYAPLSLGETIQWLKRGLLRLERASIPVARIGLQPTRELEDYLLAGPFHPALHQLIDSEIFFDMAVELLQSSPAAPDPRFFCHPQEVSNLRGQKNTNIEKLKNRFGLREISVGERRDLWRGSLCLQAQGGDRSMRRTALSY